MEEIANSIIAEESDIEFMPGNKILTQHDAITLLPGNGCGEIFRESLKKLKRQPGIKRLILRPGDYYFHKKSAIICSQPISNTLTYGLNPIKHFGLLLDGINDFILEGNGARLLFDGDMSAIGLNQCQRIKLENFSLDYIRPRVSEMTVMDHGDGFVDYVIHPDSKYAITSDGNFCWANGDGVVEDASMWQIAQCAFPHAPSNLRVANDPIRDAERFEFLEDGTVRFYYHTSFDPPVGAVYQFRHPTRNEVGIMLHQCCNIELLRLHLFFTPGLGVIAQLCENIVIRHHRHEPAADSNRVCAAFADCIQISSCRGQVTIEKSCFSGSHDDPINIHGTYLGIDDIFANEIKVSFRHPETWGFVPFEPGDRIALVEASRLQRLEEAVVKTICPIDARNISLILEEPLTGITMEQELVVENLSANPDVRIEHCSFTCYPTRGILLTSSGKCLIHDNTFVHSSFDAAILIAGDAGSWFESGGVRDVTISNNRFWGCRNASIAIMPEVIGTSESPVHQNVKIYNNKFTNCGQILLRAHHVAGLRHDIPANRVHNDLVFALR